jgi:hypothetical protein
MSQARIIDGTGEEIASLLQSGTLAGHRLRLIVDPEPDDDLSADLPTPPNSVRSREQLLELLREGMQGAPEPVTKETWRRLHERIDNHPNARP